MCGAGHVRTVPGCAGLIREPLGASGGYLFTVNRCAGPAYLRTVRTCAGRTAEQSAAGGLSVSTEETTRRVSRPAYLADYGALSLSVANYPGIMVWSNST